MVAFVASTGCGREAQEKGPPGEAVTAPIVVGNQDTIVASWKTFMGRVTQNANQALAKNRAAWADTPWMVSVSGDVKKSDSLVNPYVGILTVVESFETPKSANPWRHTYRVEMTPVGGNWNVLGGEVDILETKRGEPSHQVTKKLSVDEVHKRLGEYLR